MRAENLADSKITRSCAAIAEQASGNRTAPHGVDARGMVVVERTLRRMGHWLGRLLMVAESLSAEFFTADMLPMQWCLPARRQQAGSVVTDAAAANGSKIAISTTTVISAAMVRRIPTSPFT